MNTSRTTAERERQRRQAVALDKQGCSAAQIARQLGVTSRTVRRWRQAYRRRGEAGLHVKKAPGAKPKLNAYQRHGLRRRLLAGASTQGFATDLWTCPRIARLIEQHYGVQYHVDHIPYVMKSLGFSVQKPECSARERDEAAIQRWIERDWPRIKKRPRDSAPRSFLSMKQASL